MVLLLHPKHRIPLYNFRFDKKNRAQKPKQPNATEAAAAAMVNEVEVGTEKEPKLSRSFGAETRLECECVCCLLVALVVIVGEKGVTRCALYSTGINLKDTFI